MRRSGRAASNCAWRRKLEVPTRAPGGRPSIRSAPRASSASNGSARARTAAISSPFGQIARHILHRMYGNVGPAFLESGFQFLDEQALAADGSQAPVLNTIALGRHRHQFDLEPGVGAAQQGGHVFCLPECQRALARGDSQRRRSAAHVDPVGPSGKSADFKR